MSDLKEHYVVGLAVTFLPNQDNVIEPTVNQRHKTITRVSVGFSDSVTAKASTIVLYCSGSSAITQLSRLSRQFLAQTEALGSRIARFKTLTEEPHSRLCSMGQFCPTLQGTFPSPRKQAVSLRFTWEIG